MADRQFCTFYVDGHYIGIDVVEVQEVIRYQEMTHVPLAPTEISGLINLRGQIVTALDLRGRLGMPPADGHRMPMNVVVRTAEGSMSLLVDEIGDVIEVGDDSFERPPATLTGRARTLVRGAYKLDQQLLLVLDTERAVAVEAA
jgi:purine-binding chemotaxis protein CheW